MAKDMPRIRDIKVTLNDLVRSYHDLLHPFSLTQEVGDYDALVTEEWHKVTRGRTDTDSMNTVFLCLAAGKPPKPAISRCSASPILPTSTRYSGSFSRSVRRAPHDPPKYASTAEWIGVDR